MKTKKFYFTNSVGLESDKQSDTMHEIVKNIVSGKMSTEGFMSNFSSTAQYSTIGKLVIQQLKNILHDPKYVLSDTVKKTIQTIITNFSGDFGSDNYPPITDDSSYAEQLSLPTPEEVSKIIYYTVQKFLHPDSKIVTLDENMKKYFFPLKKETVSEYIELLDDIRTYFSQDPQLSTKLDTLLLEQLQSRGISFDTFLQSIKYYYNTTNHTDKPRESDAYIGLEIYSLTRKQKEFCLQALYDTLYIIITKIPSKYETYKSKWQDCLFGIYDDQGLSLNEKIYLLRTIFQDTTDPKLDFTKNIIPDVVPHFIQNLQNRGIPSDFIKSLGSFDFTA